MGVGGVCGARWSKGSNSLTHAEIFDLFDHNEDLPSLYCIVQMVKIDKFEKPLIKAVKDLGISTSEAKRCLKENGYEDAI